MSHNDTLKNNNKKENAKKGKEEGRKLSKGEQWVPPRGGQPNVEGFGP
jgi:hypothetical protein